MKKFAIAVLALTFAVAATPSEVAPVIDEQGYFIEAGSDATDDVIAGAVADARDAGGHLSIVALAEDPSQGCATFAESTLEQTSTGEGTVLCLSPGLVGWAKHNSYWTTSELNDALEVALDGATSDESAVLFVDSLLGVGEGGGSGFWIFLGFIIVVVGGIAFLVWRSNKSSQKRAAQALARMKTETQGRIDALANDILDDEDEVTEAGNREASDRFDKATATYSEASDRLGAAKTPEEVVEIAGDVDEAIWHLDSAEAILDGSPLPPKPERPRPPEPDPAPESAVPGSRTSNAPVSTSGTRSSTGVPPLEPYRRRQTRQSSFGADDMMKAMLAMQAMKSIGGRRSGSSGSRRGSSGGSSSGSGSRSPGRSRGGGRKRR